MKFTLKEKQNAELSMRKMNEAAFKAYSGIEPLVVYEKETEDGKRYFLRGAYEYNNLSFEEMEKFFTAEAEENEKFLQEEEA